MAIKTSSELARGIMDLPSRDGGTARIRRVESLLDGKLLAKWLNAARDTKSHERIHRLIVELPQLRNDYNAASRDRVFMRFGAETTVRRDGKIVEILPADSDFSPITQEKIRRAQVLAERHDALQGILGRYSYSIGAVFVLARGEWLSGLITKHRRGEFVLEEEGQRPYGEGDAAFTILSLFEAGDLEKMRSCPSCGRWQYVRQRSYFACNAACRYQHYKKDPEFKKKAVVAQQKHRKKLKDMLRNQQALAESHGVTPRRKHGRL